MMYKQEWINSIKNLIKEQKSKEDKQVLEILYLQYVGREGLDEEEVRNGYAKIDQELKELPFAKRNLVECTVTQICAVQERKAFLEGCHTGVQLILELLDC